jgi:predicted transcriptional regulator
MYKARAIELLGGTQILAAQALGITQSAVSQWPDVLTRRLADQVIATVARKYLRPEVIGLEVETNASMDLSVSTEVSTLRPERVSTSVSTG